MVMTKRDFNAIASRWARLYETEGDSTTVRRMVDEFCAVAKESNPRFNEDRFKAAVFGSLS